MTPLHFAGLHLGRHVAVPGGAGQCVDLANLWLSTLGTPSIRLDAYSWAAVKVPGHSWVVNSPFNYPPIGSLIVWGPYPALSIGEYGHIALALVADVGHLVSLDQNWPGGAPVSLVLHAYGGVLGWHQPG